MIAQQPRRIMLATDLTPACDRAFDRAIQLAQEWDAELVICHVIESSALRPWGIEQRVRNTGIELDRLVSSSPIARMVPRHIVVGDPANRTLEHARQIECDFLVTGPAHGKILGEKLLGSTAARIMRRASQPVLSVRRRPQGSYKKIATAVDFSAASKSALIASRTLFPEAQLTALHAFHISPNWTGANADKSIDVVEAEERARVLQQSEQDMADLFAALGRGAGSISSALLEGAPDTSILGYVEKNWPELVVAGTHGKSGAHDDAIGSVAELLLMTLPCDVLAIPTRTK
jgi:nucleotide-binding universal stress UspA family protein